MEIDYLNGGNVGIINICLPDTFQNFVLCFSRKIPQIQKHNYFSKVTHGRPVTRNNYVDFVWFHIKQQIMEQLSMDIVCIFEIIYAITIYHYRAANKLLLKIIIHHINRVTKPPRTPANCFLSRNIS